MTGSLGSPKRLRQAWPGALVQTCVDPFDRASMRYVAYADRKAVAAALRPVYTAVDADAALAALVAFADSHFGQEVPGRGSDLGRERVGSGSSRSWTSVPRLGEVIYTTNSIESLNYQLRKIIKNRGQSPQRCRGGQTVVAGDPQHRGR